MVIELHNLRSQDLDECFDSIKRTIEIQEQAKTTKRIWFEDKWPANEQTGSASKKRASAAKVASGKSCPISDSKTRRRRDECPVAETILLPSPKISPAEIITRKLLSFDQLSPPPKVDEWRYKPKREKRKEITTEERADLQISIDRQIEQAGLANPTSPAQDFVNMFLACDYGSRFPFMYAFS